MPAAGVADGGPSGRVVRVVPDVPAIHRRFDYTVPPSLAADIQVGSRVRVELHGRRVAAWVVEDDVTPPEGVEPKPLAKSSGAGPPAPVVALAQWAAWRWAGPVSAFLGVASPPRVVRPAAVQAAAQRSTGETGRRTPAVASPGGGSVELVDRALAPGTWPSVVRLAPALDATLVVLELVHRLGPAGVLVLAPSLVRAAQVADRLRVAGAPVAVLPEQWAEAASGGCVVVGTRTAAWAPVPALRAALVLDAHDESYRAEGVPTWSAVDVVRERGARDGSPVVLVSPCPTVALAEGAPVVVTDRAVERRGWPVVEVADRRGDDPRTGLFSERLVTAVRAALARPPVGATGGSEHMGPGHVGPASGSGSAHAGLGPGHGGQVQPLPGGSAGSRVVCVLNRTGRARLLACAACGSLARCTRCGGPVAQLDAGGPLVCRRCGEARPPVCAVCDSTRLKVVRMGVSRAVEELSALVGEDAVEVSGGTDAGTATGARLVVGTEAALHRVERADLVAFLDLDQHLLAPRFGASEETLALLARAARLVGGRSGGGRVIVQTRLPDHEVLQAAVHADPGVLTAVERPLRLALSLPPFAALALVRGAAAATYADALRARPELTVSSLGLDGDRWLVKAEDHRSLCDGLASVPRPAGRLQVEVDPIHV